MSTSTRFSSEYCLQLFNAVRGSRRADKNTIETLCLSIRSELKSLSVDEMCAVAHSLSKSGINYRTSLPISNLLKEIIQEAQVNPKVNSIHISLLSNASAELNHHDSLSLLSNFSKRITSLKLRHMNQRDLYSLANYLRACSVVNFVDGSSIHATIRMFSHKENFTNLSTNEVTLLFRSLAKLAHEDAKGSKVLALEKLTGLPRLCDSLVSCLKKGEGDASLSKQNTSIAGINANNAAFLMHAVGRLLTVSPQFAASPKAAPLYELLDALVTRVDRISEPFPTVAADILSAEAAEKTPVASKEDGEPLFGVTATEDINSLFDVPQAADHTCDKGTKLKKKSPVSKQADNNTKDKEDDEDDWDWDAPSAAPDAPSPPPAEVLPPTVDESRFIQRSRQYREQANRLVKARLPPLDCVGVLSGVAKGMEGLAVLPRQGEGWEGAARRRKACVDWYVRMLRTSEETRMQVEGTDGEGKEGAWNVPLTLRDVVTDAQALRRLDAEALGALLGAVEGFRTAGASMLAGLSGESRHKGDTHALHAGVSQGDLDELFQLYVRFESEMLRPLLAGVEARSVELVGTLQPSHSVALLLAWRRLAVAPRAVIRYSPEFLAESGEAHRRVVKAFTPLLTASISHMDSAHQIIGIMHGCMISQESRVSPVPPALLEAACSRLMHSGSTVRELATNKKHRNDLMMLLSCLSMHHDHAGCSSVEKLIESLSWQLTHPNLFKANPSLSQVHVLPRLAAAGLKFDKPKMTLAACTELQAVVERMRLQGKTPSETDTRMALTTLRVALETATKDSSNLKERDAVADALRRSMSAFYARVETNNNSKYL